MHTQACNHRLSFPAGVFCSAPAHSVLLSMLCSFTFFFFFFYLTTSHKSEIPFRPGKVAVTFLKRNETRPAVSTLVITCYRVAPIKHLGPHLSFLPLPVGISGSSSPWLTHRIIMIQIALLWGSLRLLFLWYIDINPRRKRSVGLQTSSNDPSCPSIAAILQRFSLWKLSQDRTWPWNAKPPSAAMAQHSPLPIVHPLETISIYFPIPESPLCESCFLTPPERLQKPIGFHAWKDRITASLRLEKTSASVENHNLGGNKMTLEEFKHPFQVNPIILPRDITCMSSKDTQKANSLTFFGTESISFFWNFIFISNINSS